MSSNPLVDILPITGEELPDEALASIMTLLRERRRFDLHNYKDGCVRRRIVKRLRASGTHDIAGYLERLAGDDQELDLLVETLSVHVSRFFRDIEVFRLLERQVLPELCARLLAAGRTQLRLWSAGCAGGEEAYSLALLAGDLAPTGVPVTIFATDVSEPVLAQARAGVYPPSHLSELPEQLRESCFQREGGGYRLDRRIRERVDFQCHDLIESASYPQADLILCRNVLIYFSHEEQARILARFAAALSEGGMLVLGRTENLLHTETPLFRAEFPRERIFRRLPAGQS